MCQPTSSSSSPSTKPLALAPPPWHAVALVGALTIGFASQLPKDLSASSDLFTAIVLDEYVSLWLLGILRLTAAAIIFCTSLATILSDGWVQLSPYLPQSKLQRVAYRIRGWRTMYPFTSWSWNLLGLAFGSAGYIALAVDQGWSVPDCLPTVALVLWEIAAPFTILVSAIVRYVIWPGVLLKGDDTKPLKHPNMLLMHNLNVALAMGELALGGGLPVYREHLSLAPLVGMSYVVFTWWMAERWHPSSGPQFIYFFLDTTLGWLVDGVLLALLLVLMTAYSVFCWSEQLLTWLDGGLALHMGFAVVVCGSVMRFRD